MKAKPRKLRILVTAGPTQEGIDPVRYLSNRSTGFMGYEIARCALRRGHNVVLISGPTHLSAPRGVRFIPVVTAHQMRRAVMSSLRFADCLFMVAAVSDWRIDRVRRMKIKRVRKSLSLSLRPTPDILRAASLRKGKRIFIGFSLETKNPVEAAKKKLQQKKLDLIVANTFNGGCPFGPLRVKSAIIEKNGKVQKLPRMPKRDIARLLLDRVENMYCRWRDGRGVRQ